MSQQRDEVVRLRALLEKSEEAHRRRDLEEDKGRDERIWKLEEAHRLNTQTILEKIEEKCASKIDVKNLGTRVEKVEKSQAFWKRAVAIVSAVGTGIGIAIGLHGKRGG